MSEKLRHVVPAGLSVTGVFACYLLAMAVFVEIDLTLSTRLPEILLRLVFDLLLLVFASGILPSLILRQFGTRSIWTYACTGTLSGLLTLYLVLFWFAETFTLFEPRPMRSLGTLIAHAFTDHGDVIPSLVGEALQGTVVAALVGGVCGGLFWLVFVRRRREERTVH